MRGERGRATGLAAFPSSALPSVRAGVRGRVRGGRGKRGGVRAGFGVCPAAMPTRTG